MDIDRLRARLAAGEDPADHEFSPAKPTYWEQGEWASTFASETPVCAVCRPRRVFGTRKLTGVSGWAHDPRQLVLAYGVDDVTGTLTEEAQRLLRVVSGWETVNMAARRRQP